MKLLAAKPLPTVNPAPAFDRDAENAVGASLGVYACPVCGDSMLWKAFHETPYVAGQFQTHEGVTFSGHKSVHVLCEPCWAARTPAERLPFYVARMAGWSADVKTVIKVPAGDGTFAPDPADAARHAADLAVIDAEREAVKAAVLAGG